MNRYKKFIAILPLPFLMICAQAQEITQTLRGRIVETVSGKPVQDAVVALKNTQMSVLADTEGWFTMGKIAVGRYQLTVSSVGFQTLILTDVLVESGKETVLEMAVQTAQTALDTFVLVAQSPDKSRISYPTISVIEKLRFQYPATFADPARYASYAAGVATDNDQANNLSIRGVSPNAMQWYLEGAEIVNPNHLSNAGTLSDRAAANGGGVMILPSQLLNNTSLYQGAMPPQYGNALAGALDMRLRKGNNSRRQSTVQLSLIGVEAGTEGGLSPDSKASYLVNYRYSTVGLLSKLGVPLGDEAINYQDAAFHLNLPSAKMGEFSIWGVGGTSENIFKAKKSPEWVVDKDSQDINFTGKMGALGLQHRLSLSAKTRWQSSFVVSALENQREAIGYTRLQQVYSVETVQNSHAKYFFRTEINTRLGKYTEGVFGMVVKQESLNNDNTTKIPSGQSRFGGDGSGIGLTQYVDISGRLANNLTYKVGMRTVYYSFNEKLSLEPSAILRYNIASNSHLQVSYGAQSQMVQPQFYFAKNEKGIYVNQNLDFLKSENLSLSINTRLKNDLRINLEAFWQDYANVYYQTINSPQVVIVSLLDDLNTLNGVSKSNKGTANSKGLALTTNQNLPNGLFWQANVALFDARFKDGLGTDRSLSYNSRYTTNALLGKEWRMGSKRHKFFGVSGRVILRGGFWMPTDKEKWVQGKDYFRTDLNVYFKRHRKNWQSTLQLDIQNVTNRENEWSVIYDRLQQRYLSKKQLGLLPNLAYKVEF